MRKGKKKYILGDPKMCRSLSIPADAAVFKLHQVANAIQLLHSWAAQEICVYVQLSHVINDDSAGDSVGILSASSKTEVMRALLRYIATVEAEDNVTLYSAIAGVRGGCRSLGRQ